LISAVLLAARGCNRKTWQILLPSFKLESNINLRAYPEISRVPIVPQIFRQTRRFFAGGLSPGKKNQRRMAENMRCEWCAANFGISSKS